MGSGLFFLGREGGKFLLVVVLKDELNFERWVGDSMGEDVLEEVWVKVKGLGILE